MKVKQFYNKNQFIITGNGETVFQSYDSTIAKIDKNGVLTLGNAWDYSHTTLKHLYLFINDYLYNLHQVYFGIFKDLDEQKNKKAYINKMINAGAIQVTL